LAIAKKRATIKDVAAEAGVSYQTVSRVINNQSGVTRETRARVEQAIRKLNFRPNLAARTLPRRRSHIIGLIVPYEAAYLFRDPNLLAQINCIDTEANARDYNLLLSTAGGSGSGLEAYQRFIRNQVADGALVVETANIQEGNQLLTQHNYPYVSLGYDLSGDRAYSVHHNDKAGAKEATRHLLHQGHRRIGIIDGPPLGAVVSLRQRLLGHQEILAEAGLSFDPDLVAYGDYTRRSGQLAAEQLLALPDPPTAIFALNDRMAMGAIWAVQAAGLRVPADVAVVGFDDVPAAAEFSIPLTTVSRTNQQMGQVASRMLFQLIADEPVEPREVVLPAKLVIRKSA
jgi:DNA-binding LacI/PurR family transcriptional regulator